MLKKYRLISDALGDFPDSMVLVGQRFGEDYHRIICQQRVLQFKPQAYYKPDWEPYPIGVVLPRCELQDIADRYYDHNQVYINNTIKIYERNTRDDSAT